MAKQWLTQRLEILIPALVVLGKEQEDEIKRLCEEEIATWRARPTMKSLSSLKEPMTLTRNALRELEVTENNSWVNPKTDTPEHLALKYMNYGEREWIAMNALSEKHLQERLNAQQVIEHPDAVVAKATHLLTSSRWQDLVVGLAVTTGRQLAEVLKTGSFLPKTRYTVIFEGQLKRQDKLLSPYEIPTLVEAEMVLSAWQRLRRLIECSTEPTATISTKYGPAVSEAAQQFADLVPPREGGDLYTHLFRSVYGCLAVFYYCPERVADLNYLNSIAGHYWVPQDGTGTIQRDYAATLHYYDYRIADGNGEIRKGVKLGQPGVEILDEFKPKVPAPTKKRRKSALLSTNQTGFSRYKPRQQTKILLDQIGDEIGARIEDDTLRHLVEEHYLLAQLRTLVAPMQYEGHTVLETVESMLTDTNDPRVVDHLLQERWHTSLEQVETLFAEVAETSDAQEEPSPVTQLHALIEKHKHFKAALAQRHAEK
ncbi:MAG: hypothetical protein H0U76_13695, partial [Ktedonobacteraceae bacterium]|nr:hypothetical protein [Ktedonobacteraceae bacterium]